MKLTQVAAEGECFLPRKWSSAAVDTLRSTHGNDVAGMVLVVRQRRRAGFLQDTACKTGLNTL